MDIKIISETKTELVFELPGEDHTILNLLKDELNKIDGVNSAGYNIRHPLVKVPKFLVHTTTKVAPRDALKEAIKNIRKNIKSAHSSIETATKAKPKASSKAKKANK
jgi:DNA-directed RNA polymerase subunit L